MKASEWIDQVKAARGWDSDYRVAKELGLSRNTISNYRSGVRTLDDETAEKVAAALDVEPHLIAIDQLAERTHVDSVRVGVMALLERITGKARAGGGGSAAKAPLDITSVTAFEGGDPERAMATNGVDRLHIASTRHRNDCMDKPLQLLVQTLAGWLSYSPAIHAA